MSGVVLSKVLGTVIGAAAGFLVGRLSTCGGGGA